MLEHIFADLHQYVFRIVDLASRVGVVPVLMTGCYHASYLPPKIVKALHGSIASTAVTRRHCTCLLARTLAQMPLAEKGGIYDASY